MSGYDLCLIVQKEIDISSFFKSKIFKVKHLRKINKKAKCKS